MVIAIPTPLSYVRSTTNDASPIDKSRRRSTFSLHLDINLIHSFCVTSSQSTTPALSPTQSCVLSSPSDSPPSSPVTPSITNQWLNEGNRSLTERTPTFNFTAWPNRDPHYFAIPDSPSSSTIHTPAHASIQSGNRDRDVLYENHQQKFVLHPAPQANFGGQNPISSVPQEGADMGQPLSTRVKNDNSARVSPPLRPRSRPRDEIERTAADHIVPRELAGTSQLRANTCPPYVVSANYRQLSAREMKEMKLGPHRRHYKCIMDGCDRLFSRKSNVENHIRTHLDDKPFICSLSTWWVIFMETVAGFSPGRFGTEADYMHFSSNSAFVRKGDLLRHEEIHRPRRAHTCSW